MPVRQVLSSSLAMRSVSRSPSEDAGGNMKDSNEKLIRGFGARLREEFQVQGNVIPIELAWRLQELVHAEKVHSAKLELRPQPGAPLTPCGQSSERD